MGPGVILDEEEKKLARDMIMVQMNSKMGELVPVLLRLEQDRAVMIIARLRCNFVYKLSNPDDVGR